MRITGGVLAVCVLVGCTGEAREAEPGSTLGAGTTTTTQEAEATIVRVQFPEVNGVLFGSATGRVLDQNGAEVATFEFESGWILPEQWGVPGDTAVRTGAPTAIDLELPHPGWYTFVLDGFGVSHNPCGTCEQGFAGGAVEAVVLDGTVIQLPLGDSTWVS